MDFITQFESCLHWANAFYVLCLIMFTNIQWCASGRLVIIHCYSVVNYLKLGLSILIVKSFFNNKNRYHRRFIFYVVEPADILPILLAVILLPVLVIASLFYQALKVMLLLLINNFCFSSEIKLQYCWSVQSKCSSAGHIIFLIVNKALINPFNI